MPVGLAEDPATASGALLRSLLFFKSKRRRERDNDLFITIVPNVLKYSLFVYFITLGTFIEFSLVCL